MFAAHRSGADASRFDVACLQLAPIAFLIGLDRLGDGLACGRSKVVESMCACSSVSSTECVTVMVEVGAHAPTSHPSQSPSGIKTSTACQPAGREKSRGSWSKLTATCVCGLTLVQEGVPISTELSPRSLQVCKGCRCCHIVTRGRSKWSQNKKWQEPEILVQIPLDNSVCVH